MEEKRDVDSTRLPALDSSPRDLTPQFLCFFLYMLLYHEGILNLESTFLNQFSPLDTICVFCLLVCFVLSSWGLPVTDLERSRLYEVASEGISEISNFLLFSLINQDSLGMPPSGHSEGREKKNHKITVISQQL